MLLLAYPAIQLMLQLGKINKHLQCIYLSIGYWKTLVITIGHPRLFNNKPLIGYNTPKKQKDEPQ